MAAAYKASIISQLSWWDDWLPALRVGDIAKQGAQ